MKRRAILSLLAALASLITFVGCGDVTIAFVVREDSSATIRYTYLSRNELKDTAKVYIAARKLMDSILTGLRSSGAIQAFSFSPVQNSAFELNIRLQHYRQIDNIHRLICSTANLYNTGARLSGIEPGMRDSIVFEESGDSIKFSILGWVPKSIDTAKFIEAAADLGRMLQKFDSLGLLKGGKDSLRAIDRIKKRQVIKADSLYRSEGVRLAQLYFLPRRRYSLNVPFMLMGEERPEFSSLVIEKDFASATWWNLNLDREDATEALGYVPSQWFKLRSPSANDRSAWRRHFNWCEECEQGFKAARIPGSGIQAFTNELGTTTLLISCGADSLGKRTLFAYRGYSDSADNFSESEIHTVFRARPDSDTITAWRSDMFVGDVQLDTAKQLITVTHTAGSHSILHSLSLRSLKPQTLNLQIMDANHRWMDENLETSFTWDLQEDCSSW